MILLDGDAPNCQPGCLAPKYAVSLFKLERHNAFIRLDLQSARDEFDPIPEYVGPFGEHLLPHPQIRRESQDQRYRRIDFAPVRLRSHPGSAASFQVSLIENAMRSGSPTSKSRRPTITPLPTQNPRVFSSGGFISKRDLSPAAAPDHTRAKSKRVSRYSYDQTTFAPGSIVEPLPTLSPNASDLTDPCGSNNSDLDDEEEASPRGSIPTIKNRRNPARSGEREDAAPRSIAPTQEQRGTLAAQVIDSVADYLRAGHPTLPDEDFPITGHPVTWLMNRARGFGASFRPHRAPAHPADEMIANKSSREVRKLISVYGKRLARSVAPEEKQKRAPIGAIL